MREYTARPGYPRDIYEYAPHATHTVQHPPYLLAHTLMWLVWNSCHTLPPLLACSYTMAEVQGGNRGHSHITAQRDLPNNMKSNKKALHQYPLA
jgi:hypothetical protein